MALGLSAVRIVLAVVAGYASMVVVVFAGITVLWLLLGPEAAFRDNTTVASTSWSLLNCASGLLAGAAGGWVAAAVAKEHRRRAAAVLVILVLALGTATAFTEWGAEPSSLPHGQSTADLTFFEAGAVASSPSWYLAVIPLIGAGGVLWGSRCCPLGSRPPQRD